MKNLKKRVFTHKSKSKIFITILCIFGLLFSYSCSCKNKVTGPGNDGLENGRQPTTNDKGGSVITPSMTLSTNLMVIDNAGTKTTESITITVDNADFEIADITGVEGLTKADFTLANGVLSLTKSFDKVDITEKTLTLTVNYKKKSTAGANDTLSKTTDKTTFNVVKVQKVQNNSIEQIIQSVYSDRIRFKSEDFVREVSFSIAEGTYDEATKTFTLKEQSNSLKDSDAVIDKNSMKNEITAYLRNAKKYFTSVDAGEVTDVSGNPNKIEFEVTLNFNSIYETDIEMSIKIAVEKTKGGWK